ncbi:MAG: hypothetical protein IT425_06110 [Pirellulales bacterium]|nr:hypothetical protein [Pirellulales bacterium]
MLSGSVAESLRRNYRGDMHLAVNSVELLSHFDCPEAIYTASEVAAYEATTAAPQRGMGWVLQWSAALGVIIVAGCVLIEFGHVAVAEQSLHRAARAGAMEATLPRATLRSVTESVERSLKEYPHWAGHLRISLLQNGRPVARRFQAVGGDRFSITLLAPTDEVVPTWLGILSPWLGENRITARAEREVPGRHVARANLAGPAGR